MTTTPNEPVRDTDIETSGIGSTTAPGSTGPGDGLDGAEGGPLDTQDESDADGSDADGGDADGGDADGGDADGSDGSRDGAEGGPLDTQDEADSDGSDA